MGRHSIEELRERLSPERRAEIDARIKEELLKMALADVRKAMLTTQVDLAERMGRAQGNISEMEHRSDMFISTLREYICALGGELEIRARFPGDVEVLITQFDVVPA
jgi:hypothetical protein